MRARRPAAPDRGATFVELLVSIVLLGTVVIATLAGLRATIIASTVDEETAKAYAWLQAASDAIERAPHEPCSSTDTASAIRDAYALTLEPVRLQPPDDWDSVSGATIDVTRVDLLRIKPGTNLQEWSANCSAATADDSLVPQKVTLTATAPDGGVSAKIEVIKGA